VINATTRVDLEAVEAVRNWGIFETVIRVPTEPCPRPWCGGSMLTFEEERVCILCARRASDPEPSDIPPLIIRGGFKL
jgi:hypothetical protein